ncbi:hypothetical protein FQR65_LT20408 [Abscondita terminalis]|nr:hypothetical protein FQR65_LT20408 [Abscondita terminalis]
MGAADDLGLGELVLQVAHQTCRVSPRQDAQIGRDWLCATRMAPSELAHREADDRTGAPSALSPRAHAQQLAGGFVEAAVRSLTPRHRWQSGDRGIRAAQLLAAALRARHSHAVCLGRQAGLALTGQVEVETALMPLRRPARATIFCAARSAAALRWSPCARGCTDTCPSQPWQYQKKLHVSPCCASERRAGSNWADSTYARGGGIGNSEMAIRAAASRACTAQGISYVTSSITGVRIRRASSQAPPSPILARLMFNGWAVPQIPGGRPPSDKGATLADLAPSGAA